MRASAIILSPVVAVVITMLGYDTISPIDLTKTRIMITERRIIAYVSANTRLPKSLSELPSEGSNYDDDLHDGWGRELIYAPKGDGYVLIYSLGPNGKGGKEAIAEGFQIELRPTSRQSVPATSESSSRP